MENTTRPGLKDKISNTIALAKKYWSVPPKGYYVPYKEVASISGAGIGVNLLTYLSSIIVLDASSFLVGATIGLRPKDLYIMLLVSNILGIPIGFIRAWYYDNHTYKGEKFLPFIRRTALPIYLVSVIFVWLPYDNWDYITKAIVVEVIFFILSFLSGFFNESYTYFQQVFSPDAQERANVLSISQVIYSFAPTITGLIGPVLITLSGGVNNIWTYRIVYPIISAIGLVFCLIFFRKVKERIILPKTKPEPVRFFDALREAAKNKYYWIIQFAAWVIFLESGYGIILSWSFVYSHEGKYYPSSGIATTLIGNAALWAMLLTPFAIKRLGKRNLMILTNAVNVVFLIALYFSFESLILICILWYINNFFSTFWNIAQFNIISDMKDYHQWKTGVRIDGMFGPLGLIGTFISFFTGAFYPTLYEKMGLGEDYSVLYDDAMRNGLFRALIICSIFGAIFNLIPFIFYDLTENKHKGYVEVLKIRAMFEDYGAGLLDDDELKDSMAIILRTRELYGKEKVNIDKSALKEARKMPKKTEEEKNARYFAIKKAKEDIKNAIETNLAIERSPIIMEDLNKFSGEAANARITAATKAIANGLIYDYTDAADELKAARCLPKSNSTEKEIRSDAIKLARVKKESSKLIHKYGMDYIREPDESIKKEIQDREISGFFDSLRQRRELKEYAKSVSVYNRVVKPYTDSKNLITQRENYTHYEELENKYYALIAAEVAE